MSGSGFRCPGCGKLVRRRASDFPFCGERCRLLDLANWASERYAISSSLPSSEVGLSDEE